MAQPIICDMDNVERADWLMGELESGQQLALCNGCLVTWCLARLDIALDAEAKAVVVAMWSPMPAGDGQEGGPAVDAPKSRSGRPGRARRAPDGRRQAEVDQEASAVALAAQEPAPAPEAREQAAAADSG